MKQYKDFIEYFGNSSIIVADDNYISDGIIVLKKDFLNNKLLNKCKTHDEDILEMAKVPFEKGEEWIMNTECKILSNSKIGIIIDDENAINYSLIELFEKSTPFKLNYTILPFKNSYIIKIFLNKKFIGLIAGIKF